MVREVDGNSGVRCIIYEIETTQKIISVDSENEVWKASGTEKSVGVMSHTKGDSILLMIGVKNCNNFELKFFEKLNGKWDTIEKDMFSKKLNEMKG